MANATLRTSSRTLRRHGPAPTMAALLAPLVPILLGMALSLLALPGAALARTAWTRLAGEDAYGTMAAVVRAADAFPDGGSDTVVVASGEGYWDALSASGLAGTLGAPVLITPSDHLDAQTREEVERLRPRHVLVCGGPVAVSEEVLGELRLLCPDVSRLAGERSDDTAARLHEAGEGWSRTAVVATSDGYWDALSIAPFAYVHAAPIFLTSPSAEPSGRTLSASTLDALARGGFEEVLIVGGALSVAPEVEDQIRRLGASPTRLAGASAIDTSAEVALWELGRGMGADGMGVASAGGYWDALTGASLCGSLDAVLVLTEPGTYTAIDAVLAAVEEEPARGYVFGGPLSVPPATLEHFGGTGAPTGPLHVEGSRMVDAGGNPVQLRGVSTHGLAWFPDYVNEACFRELREQWRMSVIRLALYTQEYGGYCSGGDRAALLDLVERGIAYATDAGLYVIVDWHTLSDANPLTHLDEARDFFATVASRHGDRGNVIYEICNEPNGGTTWADVRRYAEQVIPVIRQHDPDGVVIVGTPTWSQEVDKALADPLGFDNVLYSLHFYAATHGADLRERMVSCAQAGLPVFVSEFGICDASGSGSIDEPAADEWVAAMNSLGVSWCMWSLCNKAESASVIAPSCTKTSGFVREDLAQAGAWLYRTLTSDTAYARLEGYTREGADVPADTADEPPATPPAAHEVREGDLRVRATLVNSWQEGERTSYQYEASVTNEGAAVSSWQVSLRFSQELGQVVGCWNADAATDGPTLTLSSKDYNGSLASGASVGGIGFIVSAGPGLSLG